MVELYYGERAMRGFIADLPGVADATWDEAKERDRIAAGLLAEARASTTHSKIKGPDHLTRTDATRSYPDALFSLLAPDAVAIEFGHSPSGVFGGTDTKAPEGLYILWRAAGIK